MFVTTKAPEKIPAVSVPRTPASNAANNDIKSTVPPLAMGPMVGHTTHDSVTLWAYHEFTSDAIEVLLYDYDSDALLQKINFNVVFSEKSNGFLPRFYHFTMSWFHFE